MSAIAQEFILEVQGILKINHFYIPALVCSHSRERFSPCSPQPLGCCRGRKNYVAPSWLRKGEVHLPGLALPIQAAFLLYIFMPILWATLSKLISYNAFSNLVVQ